MLNSPRRSSLLVLLLALLFLQACGANAKEQRLSTLLVAVDTARIGFVAWDDSHQQEIVAKAASYDEGTAALEEYRKRRAPVLLGFELAYQAIARASLEKGDDLSHVQSVVDNLRELIKSLVDVALE